MRGRGGETGPWGVMRGGGGGGRCHRSISGGWGHRQHSRAGLYNCWVFPRLENALVLI